jgi:hypothetical protein
MELHRITGRHIKVLFEGLEDAVGEKIDGKGCGRART